MHTYFLSGLLVLWTLSSCQQEYASTANPKASKEARQLLSRLYEMRGKEVWSGQHNYATHLNRSEDTVRHRTGRLPIVWGSDFLRGYPGDYRQEVVDEAIRHQKQGHIITLMYHMIRPMGHDSLGFTLGVKGRVSDEEWERIITPGTVENDCLISKIDRPVPYLQELRDKRIPVLWRPFHEMNGMWFWYGDRRGPEGVQLLWRVMYERYTDLHGLDNLLWVWNANGPRDWPDDEAYAYDLFYPGHEYVDVLAADIYKADYQPSHHDDLVKLAEGRPIAIGECGRLPDPSLFESQPDWVWFMTWAQWIWRENTPDQVRSVYNHPKVSSKAP
ncbi:MAG: glycosyl hydrolase [Bacteroidota bacterium]